LKSSLKPSTSAEIFLDYIKTLFLPNIAEVRALDECAEEMAVLLLNIWSSHITTDMISVLIEGRVCIITFAPHTAQIFQVFDVALFNVLKWYPRYELAHGDADGSVKLPMKVYLGFK
jgi:hypothetical protein